MVCGFKSRNENCFVPWAGHQYKYRVGLGNEGNTDENVGLRTVNEPLKP